MNSLWQAIATWCRDAARAWDRFWFTPALPHTLALIRICGGAMLLYTHAVWSLNLVEFLGRDSWLNSDTVALMNAGADGNNYAWSYLYFVDSPAMLWTLHIAGLIVFAMLTIGLFTRTSAVLAWIVTLSYCHR